MASWGHCCVVWLGGATRPGFRVVADQIAVVNSSNAAATRRCWFLASAPSW